MAEKRTNLQLVQRGTEPVFDETPMVGRAQGTRSSLIISGAADLLNSEKARMEVLLREVAPDAVLHGAIRSAKSWDLRPLIAAEEEGSQAIIRLYGPEVALSIDVENRSLSLLERLNSIQDSGTALLGFGLVNGQVYIRRPLLPTSLAERVNSQEKFTFRAALGIALEVGRILQLWHKNGIIHGHLSAGNICFSNWGEVFLVDVGIYSSQIEALRKTSKEEPSLDTKYSAPEIISGGEFSVEGDIYAFGVVIKELFAKVQIAQEHHLPDLGLKRMTNEDSDAIKKLVGQMCETWQEGRAPLEYIERVLEGRSVRVEEIKEREVELARRHEDLFEEIEPEKPAQDKLGNRRRAPTELIYQAGDWSPDEELDEKFVMKDDPVEEDNWESFADVSLEPTTNGASLELPDESEEVVRQQTPEQIPARSGNGLKFAVAVLSALCVFLAYRLFIPTTTTEFTEMTDEELQSAWESGLPSEMSLVAAAAVQNPATGNPKQQKVAERLVLRSAKAGNKITDAVNFQLIKLAFDEKWEKKLTPADRRIALTVGLGKLLSENDRPKENVDLSSIHPGVMFALLATLGNSPGINAIPASRLTSLPPPLNLAFQRLVNDKPELKSGDPSVVGLAKLASRKTYSAEEALSYLREETEPRLQALVIVSSADDTAGQELLNILLDHPNLRLDHELVRWGMKVKLNTWKDLSPLEQLFILVGLPSSSKLTTTQYVHLLAHPLASTRQQAIEKLLNLIPLAHPGAVPVMTRLRSNPELLTGKQTIELAQFLEQPEKATKETVQAWCDTNPDVSIMLQLLRATASQKVASPFDSNLSLCLQRSSWRPTATELKTFSRHPDSLTRVFVYGKALELGTIDSGAGLEILNGALQTETREDLRKQIEMNVTALKNQHQ